VLSYAIYSQIWLNLLADNYQFSHHKIKGNFCPRKKTNPEKDSRREKFLLSYVVYSQIWLNLLVDDCQSSYITKLKGKQKKKKKP
jgi:hypothetical protein